MATGLSQYLANELLDAVGNNGSFAVTTVYVQLHVGDPSSTGTANPAVETTRKAASFGAASGGILTSDAAVTWTNIAGSEDATFFTAWDGDTFTIASGDLTVSLTLAS
jgi:hypothetical protein